METILIYLCNVHSVLTRDVEAVEYFFLPLPASFFKVLRLPQKFNRVRILL